MTGINLLKTGSDPLLRPLSELPDWVTDLASPQPTLYELNKQVEADGEDNFAESPLVSQFVSVPLKSDKKFNRKYFSSLPRIYYCTERGLPL